MKEITLRIPEPVARLFLKVADRLTETLGNAGSNDVRINNTQDNRDAVDFCNGLQFDLPMQDYRKEYEAASETGPLVVGDDTVLGAIVKLFEEKLD